METKNFLFATFIFLSLMMLDKIMLNGWKIVGVIALVLVSNLWGRSQAGGEYAVQTYSTPQIQSFVEPTVSPEVQSQEDLVTMGVTFAEYSDRQKFVSGKRYCSCSEYVMARFPEYAAQHQKWENGGITMTKQEADAMDGKDFTATYLLPGAGFQQVQDSTLNGLIYYAPSTSKISGPNGHIEVVESVQPNGDVVVLSGGVTNSNGQHRYVEGLHDAGCVNIKRLTRTASALQSSRATFWAK